MSRFPLRPAIVAAFALAALPHGAGAQPFAFDGFDRFSITVRYQVADLYNVQGAQALAKRIRGAADSVCSAADPINSRGEHAQCREDAIARAIKPLNAPLLIQALAGRQAETLVQR